MSKTKQRSAKAVEERTDLASGLVFRPAASKRFLKPKVIVAIGKLPSEWLMKAVPTNDHE